MAIVVDDTGLFVYDVQKQFSSYEMIQVKTFIERYPYKIKITSVEYLGNLPLICLGYDNGLV